MNHTGVVYTFLCTFESPFIDCQPCRYTFYCTPHYNKASDEGMHGTLIVE